MNYSKVVDFDSQQSQHLTDWAQSAIDPDIIDLNFRSIDQEEAFHFIKPNLQSSDRRNDGRLRDGLLRTYNHLEDGGWICTGIDPLTMTPSEWGSLKPDNPRWDSKNEKFIKYENPHGVPTELFCLLFAWKNGFKIAKEAGLGDIYAERFISQSRERARARAASLEGCYSQNYQEPETCGDRSRSNFNGQGLQDSSSSIRQGETLGIHEDDLNQVDIGFWQWVKDTPALKIIITEGAKKVASLLSAGYLAIALPGIFSGYRSKINGVECSPFLLPQLEIFAAEGREIIFCFDNDDKPSTIANVNIAINKTGKLLERKGCKVSVMGWEYPHKGIDDLIFNLGVDCLTEVFNSRLKLSQWKLAKTFDISQLPQTKVNLCKPDFADLAPRPDNLEGKIIAIKSAKGTGKTEYVAKTIAPDVAKGRPVLVVTHRIQLAKELAKRFGIEHVSGVRSSETGAIFGYSLCVDSLHPESQARINPESWEGGIIVFDECEQVFWHMLNSPTCQRNRVTILQTLGKLLRTVAETNGTIVLSDADISKVTIEYIQKLTDNRLRLWLLNNGHNPNQGNRKLFSYDDPIDLLEAAQDAIGNEEKVIIHCYAQKTQSKWSTQNLETALAAKYPSKTILRIDSETVTDPTHPAYECVTNINDVVLKYDIVLASPTIETGISIDVNHFDSVWALANGVQTVDAVCQTIERVRSNVDRHICVTTTASDINKVGNGSDSPWYLTQSQDKVAKLNLSSLALSGFTEEDENNHHFHLDTWSKVAAKTNQGYQDYKNNIIGKLQQEGYDVTHLLPNADPLPAANLKSEVEEAQELNYQTERNSKIAAPNPDDFELKRLEKKIAKTKAERHKEAKGHLTRRYLTENITDALILSDDKGWHPKIQLYYYFSIGRKHLPDRDKKRLRGLSPDGYQPFIPDINKTTLITKINALQAVNIEQFFGANKIFTADSLTDWFDAVKTCARDLKNILRVGIGEKSTPITAAQRLLGLLGYRLEAIDRIRIDGVLTRRYGGVSVDFDSRFDVLARWLERDDREARMAECSTISIKSNNSNGGTADSTLPSQLSLKVDDREARMAECSTISIKSINKASGTADPTPSPTLPEKMVGDEEGGELVVGDRVRYAGQSRVWQGSLGKVITIKDDLYDCDFMGRTAKGLSHSDLALMVGKVAA